MLYAPAPLHIPDGFLNVAVSVVSWIITVIVLSLAVSKTNKALGEKQIPLMGVMAAFIFAAQMINFPVAGGTSGHLLGGALAAVRARSVGGHAGDDRRDRRASHSLSGWRLLVMGANILNMGLGHRRDRLWLVSLGDGAEQSCETRRDRRCRVAFGDGRRVVHSPAIMVERHVAIADRHPCHAWVSMR
jgi:hypothetical protein